MARTSTLSRTLVNPFLLRSLVFVSEKESFGDGLVAVQPLPDANRQIIVFVVKYTDMFSNWNKPA